MEVAQQQALNLASFLELHWIPGERRFVNALRSDDRADFYYSAGSLFDCYIWLYLGVALRCFPKENATHLVLGAKNLLIEPVQSFLSSQRPRLDQDLTTIWEYYSKNIESSPFDRASELGFKSSTVVGLRLPSVMLLARDFATDEYGKVFLKALSYYSENDWQYLLSADLIADRVERILNRKATDELRQPWHKEDGQEWLDKAHLYPSGIAIKPGLPDINCLAAGFLRVIDYMALVEQMFEIVATPDLPQGETHLAQEDRLFERWIGKILQSRLSLSDSVVETRFLAVARMVAGILKSEFEAEYSEEEKFITSGAHRAHRYTPEPFLSFVKSRVENWRTRGSSATLSATGR